MAGEAVKAVCSRSAFAWCWILSAYSVSSDRQQPSTTGPAVPAFGVPLPKAPQPTSAPTPTPTRESSQGSRKRTLEEIDAEEEEIDREEERLRAEKERLRARRRQLREERKQAYKG